MGRPDTELRFAVLGPVRAWRGTTELELGAPQQQAMLAALLLRRNRTASAGDLVDALWGEEPPARATGTLRTYASRLRRALEADRSRPEILVSAGDGYALRVPANALDSAVFEEHVAAAARARAGGDPAAAVDLLRAADGMWAGTPLAGLPGPYAEAQRIRLGERRLAALRTRLETELELGRHTTVVEELTALVDEHPLHEPLRRLLMLALYRGGRRAEALGVFSAAERVLGEELGVGPDPELADLHRRILRGDPGLAAPARPAGPPGLPAPPPAPPAQLPSDVPDFTGRAEIAARLRADLAAGPGEGSQATRTVLLSGIGGVGKSALAVHVAHAVRDHFPDGQLYTDLRGAGDDPADPAEVLAGFLRALGVAETTIPAGRQERAALFRSRLAGRRVLVLLDDARDAAQVRPLLPGTPSCAVLVTGRARTTGLALSRQVDLDALAPGEAVALLARIAGADRVAAEPDAAGQVAAACGFLPLAVRIAAARLAARPAWRLARFAERLARERNRLAELRAGDLAVTASFRLGYDQLAPDLARAFRLLALPEGPGISLPAAAALLDLPADDAGILVESLVDLGLLESSQPDRYRYHDLLRLFARTLAEEEDGPAGRRAALDRLVHHHLVAATALYQLLRPSRLFPAVPAAPWRTPPFSDLDGAVAWAVHEHASVLAVARQAINDPDGPLEAVTELVLVMVQLIDLGMGVSELHELADATVLAAHRAGHAHGEARARYTLFWTLWELRREEEARAELHRVTALSTATGQWKALAPAFIIRAVTSVHRDRAGEASGRCDEATAMVAALGVRASVAFLSSLVLMASHTEPGRIRHARYGNLPGEELSRELWTVVGWTHMVYVRARALHPPAGRDGFRTMLDILEARDRTPESMAGIAALHRVTELAGSTTQLAEESLHVSGAVDLEQRRARLLTVLGRFLAGIRAYPDNDICLQMALDTLDRIGSPAGTAGVRALLGERPALTG
ncbi:AfsR family transcriptional regulator [Actinomadura craniellae]|uniref:AfsR family transcriptional regulator n=1 Tax=Actinomadura craniellae TaxID=2231787 RepID=A0A365GW17_9ACTN|nr:BTAD domain-containing putative transcriptional regulator [Actinomadura craniellae]RAY11006.1 AfsR family transcriptional regulator [Actinomadura craniellae]